MVVTLLAARPPHLLVLVADVVRLIQVAAFVATDVSIYCLKVIASAGTVLSWCRAIEAPAVSQWCRATMMVS